MKHLEDRRVCPHCLRDINERPYMMARRATENVLSTRMIAWFVVLIVALVLVSH